MHLPFIWWCHLKPIHSFPTTLPNQLTTMMLHNSCAHDDKQSMSKPKKKPAIHYYLPLLLILLSSAAWENNNVFKGFRCTNLQLEALHFSMIFFFFSAIQRLRFPRVFFIFPNPPLFKHPNICIKCWVFLEIDVANSETQILCEEILQMGPTTSFHETNHVGQPKFSYSFSSFFNPT